LPRCHRAIGDDSTGSDRGSGIALRPRFRQSALEITDETHQGNPLAARTDVRRIPPGSITASVVGQFHVVAVKFQRLS
jgi:hypothetical protein